MSYSKLRLASQRSVLFCPFKCPFVHFLLASFSLTHICWLPRTEESKKIQKKFLFSPWNQQVWLMVPKNQLCLVRKYHFNTVISEYKTGTLTHDVLLKYCNVLLYFIFVKNFLPEAHLVSGCFMFTSETAHRLSGELIFSQVWLTQVFHPKADEINGGRNFL